MKLAGIAALSAGLGVMLSAFGAHGLEGKISEEMLVIWGTAGDYHLYTSLALLVIGAIGSKHAGLSKPYWTMFAGMVVFSGSLYAMALTGVTKLGMITPLGGALMIGAWIWLGVKFLKKPSQSP
jgi:uncharacterized membrane protein YgdD (TMEM256/DUF423 family)